MMAHQFITFPKNCMGCGVPDTGSFEIYNPRYNYTATSNYVYVKQETHHSLTAHLHLCPACRLKVNDFAARFEIAAKRNIPFIGSFALLVLLLVSALDSAARLGYLDTPSLSIVGQLFPIFTPILWVWVAIATVLFAMTGSARTARTYAKRVRKKPHDMFFYWHYKPGFILSSPEYASIFEQTNPTQKVQVETLMYGKKLMNFRGAPITRPGIVGLIGYFIGILILNVLLDGAWPVIFQNIF